MKKEKELGPPAAGKAPEQIIAEAINADLLRAVERGRREGLARAAFIAEFCEGMGLEERIASWLRAEAESGEFIDPEKMINRENFKHWKKL